MTIGRANSPLRRHPVIIPPPLRGILAMTFSMGVFIGADACTKVALRDLPLFEIVVLRGIAGTVACLIVIAAAGVLRDLPRMLNPWALARGVCEIIANFTFTVAFTRMPIADITAIAQICPLLVLLGAWLIYGETLGRNRMFLVGLGVAGALIVAQPGTSAASPYALLGFIVAAAAAGRDLITRKVPSDIPAPIVAFSVIVLIMIAGGIGMAVAETPVMPQANHIALVTLAGILMVTGQVLIFLAYKIGPVRTVAPFMYTLTVWAVFIGIVVFGDWPNTLAIIGMTLVMVSGLLILKVDARSDRPASIQ
jgi:drug/metabolite transporter (DMT)-like permease